MCTPSFSAIPFTCRPCTGHARALSWVPSCCYARKASGHPKIKHMLQEETTHSVSQYTASTRASPRILKRPRRPNGGVYRSPAPAGIPFQSCKWRQASLVGGQGANLVALGVGEKHEGGESSLGGIGVLLCLLCLLLRCGGCSLLLRLWLVCLWLGGGLGGLLLGLLHIRAGCHIPAATQARCWEAASSPVIKRQPSRPDLVVTCAGCTLHANSWPVHLLHFLVWQVRICHSACSNAVLCCLVSIQPRNISHFPSLCLNSPSEQTQAAATRLVYNDVQANCPRGGTADGDAA